MKKDLKKEWARVVAMDPEQEYIAGGVEMCQDMIAIMFDREVYDMARAIAQHIDVDQWGDGLEYTTKLSVIIWMTYDVSIDYSEKLAAELYGAHEFGID